jgi:POT family proton-dependent oligopeptide transporter
MAFKPNMTSIISYAYEKHPEKKDGAYSYIMGLMLGPFRNHVVWLHW